MSFSDLGPPPPPMALPVLILLYSLFVSWFMYRLAFSCRSLNCSNSCSLNCRPVIWGRRCRCRRRRRRRHCRFFGSAPRCCWRERRSCRSWRLSTKHRSAPKENTTTNNNNNNSSNNNDNSNDNNSTNNSTSHVIIIVIIIAPVVPVPVGAAGGHPSNWKWDPPRGRTLRSPRPKVTSVFDLLLWFMWSITFIGWSFIGLNLV